MTQKPVFLKIRVSQYLTKDEKRYNILALNEEGGVRRSLERPLLTILTRFKFACLSLFGERL